MQIFTRLISCIVFAVLAVGCTEDRQLKSVLKPVDQIMAKSQVDQESHYLYVPLGQESSRTSLYGRAFEVGQSKVVKMKINEFSLDVLSIEKDDRFGDNENNQKVLISIPIKHVDYRCQDDAYGECIGDEVEDQRIPWNQRGYIKPDFAKAEIIDTNFFAYEFAGPRSCYEEQQVEVLDRTLDSESLHFTLKRDYKDQLFFFCTRSHDLSDFTNLNWTETTSYSLVKLDTVATKDYDKAVYNRKWIRKFGFFETDDYKLDVDGNSTQTGEVKYMQRWNPDRKKVTYHLSESFDKPENEILKQATYESVKRINAGLKKSGAQFTIELEEPNSAIDPGDLRNSMIILVDDPVASSVIGYGPSIANPLTGEVVSARTVMYSGSIRKFVRFTYDDILREHQKQEALAANADGSPGDGFGQSLSQQIQDLSDSHAHGHSVMHQLKESDAAKMLDPNMISHVDQNFMVNLIDRTPKISTAELNGFMADEAKRDYIAIMAGQNKYPAEALDFGDINQDLVEEMITSIGQLKPWENLDDGDKQKVLDVLTPYVWVPTLVHEIGHNLGLRHNFSGSEDGANYYSQEELEALNVPVSTENIPYSSVMDYPKSEVNALRTLGKYDIAALRFGYAGKVALADGTLADVKASDEPIEGLKDFNFCTDDGVAPNPTCNPFDEGEGMIAIANSMIESYKDRYTSANFRRGRANFSGTSDDLYLRRVFRTFNTLRLIYERYETLTKDFDLDQATIDSIPWLKEIDDAVVVAADFMTSVVGAPDTTCVVSEVATGGLQVIPIGIFSELAHDQTRSCANLQLNPAFVVVGQGGKPINSYRLPTNPNNYADQIDVRGVWIDKAVAMNSLFNRTLGSTLFDDHNGNFLDHPKAGPQLIRFIGDILTNNLVTPVDVTFDTGQKATINLATSMDESFYEIHTPEFPLASMMLGLPYENMHLPEMLTKTLIQSVYQGSSAAGNDGIKTALKIYRNNPNPGSSEYLETDAQGSLYLFMKTVFWQGWWRLWRTVRIFMKRQAWIEPH